MMDARKYIINGTEYNVAVNSLTDENAEVTVNGVRYQVKMAKSAAEAVFCEMPSVSSASASSSPASAAEAFRQQPEPQLQKGSGKTVNSPLPGVILSLKVKAGDAVKAGQVVAILEAMKMENEIQADCSGTVISINVTEGDSILEGTPIVTIL